MKYLGYAIREAKEALPPRAIRTEAYDYAQLTLGEKTAVKQFYRCKIPLSAVPLRGQVFLRRYSKETE